MSNLLLWGHGTCRPRGMRVICVAGWATEPVLTLRHGEAGGGGGAARWSVHNAVGRRWRIEGGGAGLLSGGGIVAGFARCTLRTKDAKILDS